MYSGEGAFYRILDLANPGVIDLFGSCITDLVGLARPGLCSLGLASLVEHGPGWCHFSSYFFPTSTSHVFQRAREPEMHSSSIAQITSGSGAAYL